MKDRIHFTSTLCRYGTVLLLATIVLSGCGGSGDLPSSSGTLAGNWQFQIASPSDGSFQGTANASCPSAPGAPLPVCMGGFFLQTKGDVTGQLSYVIAAPPPAGGTPALCSAGTASVIGSVSGQNVVLTAKAGPQTFTLTGTLDASGKVITGTYSSTDGQGCGTAQSGLQWSANLVPALSSPVLGSLHSRATGGNFSVSGSLAQGPNVGASSAGISGTLSFQGYPCVTTASVSGQITGTSASLQLFGLNGLNIGSVTAVFSSSQPDGYVLSTPSPLTYNISTNKCSGGDTGYICLAAVSSLPVNQPVPVTTACTQPILLTPGSVTFPQQPLGSSATQSVTVTNVDPSGQPLNNISLALPHGSNDFNSQPTYAEQDNCTPGATSSLGSSFSLGSQQSCTISVSFTPQQSCPWISTPLQCPPFTISSSISPPAQKIPLTIISPRSLDSLTQFSVSVSGIGVSALQSSTPELDFGAEALGETSSPQMLTLTNESTMPVQILPAMNGVACVGSVPRPLVPGSAPGLQVVQNPAQNLVSSISSSLITVFCDLDTSTNVPNFQISNDSCSGAVLSPLQSCNFSVSFQPQPLEAGQPLDYLVELNTLQCTGNSTSNGVTTLTPPGCEIDAGRLPIELKSNPRSPLRMSPAAGLNFGPTLRHPTVQPTPLTVTLFNDPNDPDVNHPNPQTITFTGITQPNNSDFIESDNCGATLAPGSSCTISILFEASSVGFERGMLQIGYSIGGVAQINQTLSMEGTGQ